MSYRKKGNGWVVEIYDPMTKRKRHVKPSDFGIDPPRTERQARALERAALNARDQTRPGGADETCGSFARRWADDYGARRGESTREHNRERVKAFGDQYADRTLRSISREEARNWAGERAGTVPALRAMFNDAVEDKLVNDNPFARLGLAQPEGRSRITVLTPEEIDKLAAVAVQVHGEHFGHEFAALILWGAYTCMRPGESFAARYNLLEGDVYHVERQFNSTLRREVAPKHNSVGTIYVPEPARRAVLDKPRRFADDLIFRTKRGRQFRQPSLSYAWAPVRSAFVAGLSAGHHLRQRLAVDERDPLDFYELRHAGASYMLNELELEPWVIAKQLRHSDDGTLVVKLYGHPTREKAIERIRRAYGDNVRRLEAVSAGMSESSSAR